MTQKHPLCSIDLEIMKNNENTYPKDFFNLFGSGKELDIEEAKELSFDLDKRKEIL